MRPCCKAASNISEMLSRRRFRTPEKAMTNALKFIDHPKAKSYDVTQSFDNSLVNEAAK